MVCLRNIFMKLYGYTQTLAHSYSRIPILNCILDRMRQTVFNENVTVIPLQNVTNHACVCYAITKIPLVKNVKQKAN